MTTDEHGKEVVSERRRLGAPQRGRLVAIAYLCASAFIGGSLSCSGFTGPRSVVNDDPAVKIPEIRRAVDAKDRSVIPQLVKDLDSNDAAVRFYSIGALQRLTGDTLGYDWTVDDRHARAAAIERWVEYVSGQDAKR